MLRFRRSAFSLAALLLAGAPAFADGVTVKETKPGLLARAKIKPDAATAAAQAKVPNGTIRSAEIEEEHGKLIYSFDMKTEGKSGIDEVNVDARTGIVRMQHETAKDEANEAAKDAKHEVK
jgi:hypothetical protein